MALLNNVSGDQFGAFNTFINDAFDDVDFSKPQAYLVYMYFDKEMNLDPLSSGILQVGDANALGQLAKQGITAKDDGFFYTYVTNRSAGKVNFDNMTIVHWAPVVRVVYDYYPYGLTWENPKSQPDADAVHDIAYQGKEFQLYEFSPPLGGGGAGHGLALYDFHARMYDPCTARWLVPDPAAQFANPYLAMGNNPVVGIDPDGRFVWLIPIAVGIVAGTLNVLAHHVNNEPISLKQGLKYFTQGFIVGAAVTAGVMVGVGVPVLGPALQGVGWVYAGSTVLSAVGGVVRGVSTGDWSNFRNSGKIFLGNFYLDDRFGMGIYQGISRFSWEILQSTIGNASSQLSNFFGSIDRVDYADGYTFSSRIDPDGEYRWGISIGNHINLNLREDEFVIDKDPLKMHEFGHTFDSKIFGPLYLFAVGIPSLLGANWTEIRANQHAKRYFGRHYGVDWSLYESNYPTE